MLRLDWNILFTVINLIVLFIAMRIFLFKPVQKIIAARQEEADRQFADAAASKEEAEQLKTQYEESLANAEKEKVQTIQEARKTADQEYHRIVSDAEAVAKQLKEDAKTEAETQKAQILKNAEKEIASMVVDAAEKVVGGKSGSEVDYALYNEFIDKAGEKS
ncbi:MAG: ATP synthase F0 subunit B [Lachnospiraceae bacterium]|nr:ATP synthase F0 subunit B [Lachnospiraceae bacterium]